MPDSSILAFDLGGTDLKVARIAGDGAVHGVTKLPSNAKKGEAALLEAIARAAGSVGHASSPDIAGFGSPGVLDPESGVIVDRTPNLRLPADYPMRTRLAALLRKRGALDNPARRPCACPPTTRCGPGSRRSSASAS